LQNIFGEIYEVDEAALEFLDKFEGVHLNYYSRIGIEVQNLTSTCSETNVLQTYVLDDFSEAYFFNEETILFERYTEKNGFFGEYIPRTKEFSVQSHLEKIKNSKIQI